MKIKSLIVALSVPLLFVSCGSTSKIDNPDNDYNIETPVVSEDISDTTSDSEINENADNEESPANDAEQTNVETSVNDDYYYDEIPEKQKSGGLGQSIANFFKSDNADFVEIDEMEMFVPNTFNAIDKPRPVTITAVKGTDLIGFGSAVSASYYYVFFDKQSRVLLRQAQKKYLSDFAEKKLARKGKTEQAYGSTTTDVYFGAIKMQAKNHSKPKTYFGYRFKDKSPYFVITCMTAENLRRKESTVYPEASNFVHYYLTKAQLNDLVNMLCSDIKE